MRGRKWEWEEGSENERKEVKKRDGRKEKKYKKEEGRNKRKHEKEEEG